MLRFFALLFLVSLSQNLLAYESDLRSPAREPGVSYTEYLDRARYVIQQGGDAYLTPVDSAKKYKQAKLPKTVEWGSPDLLAQIFEKVRDNRWLIEPDRPGFLRRPSWMYPDDGCYARAALVNHLLSRWNIPAAGKVFAFGDLTSKNSNTKTGYVSWWYHVAPVVEVAGQKYVLDPSVETHHPLTLREWLSRISDNPEEVEISICGSGAYSPYDKCERESDGEEAVALKEQKAFLRMEWYRLEELHRNPVQELGDNPPWKH